MHESAKHLANEIDSISMFVLLLFFVFKSANPIAKKEKKCINAFSAVTEDSSAKTAYSDISHE